MPSPFPGMDPYLEASLWPGFHGQFCIEIARALMPKLLPKYIAFTPTIIPEQIPVISVEIRDTEKRQLVTVIELLSPTNKRAPGRDEYLQKRAEYLLGSAHLMEIDLQRGGERVPMRGKLPSADYFVFLSRAGKRPVTEVWPIALGSMLPCVPVPLLAPDPDLPLDLQAVFTSVYDSFGYSVAVRYSDAILPPLTNEQQDWARQLLKKAKKRR